MHHADSVITVLNSSWPLWSTDQIIHPCTCTHSYLDNETCAYPTSDEEALPFPAAGNDEDDDGLDGDESGKTKNLSMQISTLHVYRVQHKPNQILSFVL